MRTSFHFILCGVLGLVAGCANRGAKTTAPGASTAQQSLDSATVPATDDPAFLTLDQIGPRPTLADSTTAPIATTNPAPLDAIELFARARDALIQNQRFTAIGLYEQAAELDPDSFEIHYELAKAYLSHATSNDKSIEHMEEAARIDPDHLELQTQLGRQYLAKGDTNKAVEHLRLALQTREYSKDEESAALVDYFLARALQQKGYDRAALDRYDILLRRLQNPTLGIRENPELNYLVARPEVLYVQVAELYEKHGDHAQALRAYEIAAQRDASNFELQANVVRALLAMDRRDDATRRASELVTRFRATSESLALLQEIYRRIGREDRVVDELKRLHQAHPDDHALLFSLADVLHAQGRRDEAQAMLETASIKSPGDMEIIRRLYAIHADVNDVEGAARLLIESLARRPDLLRDISDLWSELLRPGRKNRLRLAELQKLQVAPEAEAARLFMVSRMADVWGRDLLARSAAERAVNISPAFAPAYRTILREYWDRPDWDEAQKNTASEQLIQRAKDQGESTLASELRGLLLIQQNQPAQAVNALADAVKSGNASPDMQLTYAVALQMAGNTGRAEQALWKLVSDRPTFDDAYTVLFSYYATQNSVSQIEKVLQTWLAADPGSVSARVFQATWAVQLRRPDIADKLLLRLFEDNPDNTEVLSTLHALYAQQSRLKELADLLEAERVKHPDNRPVVELLLETHIERNDMLAASQILDATRQAVGNDPEMLYDLAHLYSRIDQRGTTEEILQQVVALDPSHPAASNDLGYEWADSGKNLDRAERLIRVAVDAEPDNQSFLDSLGWVLYKRGQFEESLKYLEQAIGPAARPDPVVLDHLGDVLYRLGRAPEAAANWRRSLSRLEAAEREDLKTLRLQLIQKLKQQDQGQPVNVAPVVEGAAAPSRATQAKKLKQAESRE